MNKFTTTLAGLALVAAASVAPALAQGSFTTNGPFVFSFTPANSFTVSNLFVTYNPNGAVMPSTGYLTLTGGMFNGFMYTGTSLSFSPTLGGAATVTDTIPGSTVSQVGPTTYSIASVGSSALGDSFNLTGGSPVPEASTVLSFGALLALGGFAVLRRKTAVSNAA